MFADADLSKAIAAGAAHCFNNTGQSCNAPTRMLVQRSVYDQAVKLADLADQVDGQGAQGLGGEVAGPDAAQ